MMLTNGSDSKESTFKGREYPPLADLHEPRGIPSVVSPSGKGDVLDTAANHVPFRHGNDMRHPISSINHSASQRPLLHLIMTKRERYRPWCHRTSVHGTPMWTHDQVTAASWESLKNYGLFQGREQRLSP